MSAPCRQYSGVACVANVFPFALAVALAACTNGSEPSGPSTGSGTTSNARVVWHTALTSAEASLPLPVDSTMGTAIPAIADSTLYVATVSGGVIALDSRTGAVRWRAAAPATQGLLDAPEQLLIVGSLVIEPDSTLRALDAATGAPRWTATGPVLITSAATDGTLIFPGSLSSNAYAVDAATGAVRWTTSLGADAINAIAHPVVDQGTLFVNVTGVAGLSGRVAALDAATGTVRWQRELTPRTAGSDASPSGPVGLWQNLVVAGTNDGQVFALDRTTGAVVWIDAAPSGEPATGDSRLVAVAGGMLVASSRLGTLAGLDPASGAQRWQVDTPFGDALGITSDGTYIYIRDVNQDLGKIDPTTGTTLWAARRDSLGAENIRSNGPAVDAAQVYAATLRGVWAFER